MEYGAYSKMENELAMKCDDMVVVLIKNLKVVKHISSDVFSQSLYHLKFTQEDFTNDSECGVQWYCQYHAKDASYFCPDENNQKDFQRMGFDTFRKDVGLQHKIIYQLYYSKNYKYLGQLRKKFVIKRNIEIGRNRYDGPKGCTNNRPKVWYYIHHSCKKCDQ